MTDNRVELIQKIKELTSTHHYAIKRNIYRETLRELLNIFSNIYYLAGDGKKSKVQCITGKQDRSTGEELKLDSNLVLPFITVNETGVSESDKRLRNNNLLVNETFWDPNEKRAKRILSFAPRAIDISYEINIWCKYNADIDQLRYSILSLFNPSLDIKTKYSDFTKAFIVDESDIINQQAVDTSDRLIQKVINIRVETYLPSPKFLYTNTGEIKAFNVDVVLAQSQNKTSITETYSTSAEAPIDEGGTDSPPPEPSTGLTLNASLDDVNISIEDLETGQILTWDGTYWVASSLGNLGVSDHNLLTNLTVGNPHTQYVLTSTNLSLSSYTTAISSLVNSHINNSTIHFTSGSLSGAYVLNSTNTSLSSLVTNVQASTAGISSTVGAHIGSAVHWELATLNANYLNSSGDLANAGFYLSSVSATDISATNYYNLPSATITWQEAYDIVLYVKNNSKTVAIPRGTPVAIVSAVGDNPLVSPLSSVSSHVPEAYGFSNHVAGLAQETILADSFGHIVVEGIITGAGNADPINTSMFDEGDPLYVSSNGQLSKYRPSPPYEMHPVGVVLRSHPNNGMILVKIENASEINDIVGFNLSQTILDGDLIAYDNASKTFKNVQALNISGVSKFGSVSATTYENLPSSVAVWNASQLRGRNVHTTAPTNGDALVWNNSQNRWEPSSISTGGGSVTNNPGGNNGDIQFKNGGSFSGVDSMNYAAGVLSITNLSAVNLSSAKLDDHIASASVHFTSGSLSGYYAASSWVSANFASSNHSHSFSALSALPDVQITSTPDISSVFVFNGTDWVDGYSIFISSTNPNNSLGNDGDIYIQGGYNPYVLSSINETLSSVVLDHIGSAVHWDLPTLNANYINASGHSATAADFEFGNVSSLSISAIVYLNLPSSTATWNANKLQNINISSTAPTTSGQNLIYDGYGWKPGYTLYISGNQPSNDIGVNGDIYFDYSNTFFSAITISATNYQNLPISSLSGLADVSITSTPSQGQSLVWSSTRWVPSSVGGGGGAATAAGSNNQIQFYNNGSLSATSGFTFDTDNTIKIQSPIAGLNVYGYIYAASLGVDGNNGLNLYGGANGDSLIRSGPASSVSANKFITPSLSATTISATTYNNLPSSTAVWNASSLNGYKISYVLENFPGSPYPNPPTEGYFLTYTTNILGDLAWRPYDSAVFAALNVFNANKIQNINVSSVTPESGDVLTYDGIGWIPEKPIIAVNNFIATNFFVQ